MGLAKKISGYTLASAILLSLSFVVYFLKAKAFLDPDFGWGLRLGEVILKNGIPNKDPFSYTMPSYPYVDYEWLTHVGMAKLYSLAGYNSLVLLFTLIAISSIIICVLDSDSRFAPLQVLIASATLFSYFGVRSQVVSWLFFAMLSKIVLDGGWWVRYKYFLPVLFLFWANMHGGFIAGLVVLIFATLQKRNVKDTVIMFLSILITLVNPYGWRLWREVWISTTDLPIRLFIIEWRPIVFSITSVSLLSIAYSLSFIIQYRKKYKIFEILLCIIMLAADFSSARNIPLFLIFALILMKKGIRTFNLEVGKNRQNLFRLNLVYSFFFIIVSVLALLQMRKDYLAATTRREEVYYPRQAVSYLANNTPKGQIFSSYEWGGYLDWKLPQKKVFIDGRMASWRQRSSKSESDYVFGEHNAVLLLNVSLQGVFNKYKIDTVLIPRGWVVEKKEDSTSKITSKLIKELKKNNFREIYQDQGATIYSKKTPSTTGDNLEEE